MSAVHLIRLSCDSGARKPHQNFLPIKRPQLTEARLKERTKTRGLGRAANKHDAAEEVAQFAVVAASALGQGLEDGLVEWHDGEGLVALFGIVKESSHIRKAEVRRESGVSRP